jgi:MFS family permease
MAGFIFSPASLQELARRWTTDGDLNVEYIHLIRALWWGWMVSAGALIIGGVGGWISARWRAALGFVFNRSTLLFGAVVALTFFVTSPFVVLDLPTAARDIFYEYRHIQLGAAAHVPPSDPLYATLLSNEFFPEPFFYWNWFVAQNGLFVAAAIGIGVIALAQQRRAMFAATGLFVVLMALTLTRAANKGERYALPLLPMLYVWASVGIFALAQFVREPWRGWAKGLLVALVALPLAFTTWNGVYQNFVLPDTRVLAWRWLAQSAPPGSKIVRESNTPDLEHAPGAFEVVPTVSAFQEKTLDEWRAARVNFIVVGTVRENYLSNRAFYPIIAAEYDRLSERGALAATFIADGTTSNGPPIWIYRLP